MPAPVDLLTVVARRHRRRVSADNHHDPNVCTSAVDWRESFDTAGRSYPPDRFRHRLRITSHGRRVTLRANDRFMKIELPSEFGIETPWSINRPDHVAGLGVRTRLREWSVFVGIGASRPSALESHDLELAIETLRLGPDESLHVYRNGLVVYATPSSVERVHALLESAAAVAARLPKAAPRAPAGFEDLPAEFSALLPRFREWIICDDTDRQERLKLAPRAEVEALVEAVTPFFAAINRYLDRCGSTPPESAVALGALAQCAAEARWLLTSIDRG